MKELIAKRFGWDIRHKTKWNHYQSGIKITTHDNCLTPSYPKVRKDVEKPVWLS